MNNYYQTTIPAYYVPNQKGNSKNDERLAGGFVFPFLLGGVTGAAVAPAFWNNNRPIYYAPYPPQQAVPYYYGQSSYYYQPRRWF